KEKQLRFLFKTKILIENLRFLILFVIILEYALPKDLLCNNYGIINVKRNMNNVKNMIYLIQFLYMMCICFDKYFGNRCQHKNWCHSCQIEFCQKYKYKKCKQGWRGNNCQFNESVNCCRNGGIKFYIERTEKIGIIAFPKCFECYQIG
ncbi:hypothetical protein HZS_4180, partial [Henneguya salminicola]